MSFPNILRGSVWHTTTPVRYDQMIKEGYILPNPPIPDAERWGTAMGPEFYPFVRSINGVSLFDFRNFDEITYSEKYPFSSWREFVPCIRNSDSAIWIDVDISTVGNNFIDGVKLLAEWKKEGRLSSKIMPLIESAHIGPLSKKAFRRVLKYNKSNLSYEELILD